MIEVHTVHAMILIVFAIGYFAITMEYRIKINKTASALLMAVLTWTLLFLGKGEELASLGEHLAEVSQIIFFLLGAMTMVELIDSHKGFKVITDLIETNSKKKMLWILGIFTFFLSAILDNLTTTIVMVSLLRKLVPDKKERMILGSMVVIAANAGGAWTPIGDVTTTMLWINGNITTLSPLIVRREFGAASFGAVFGMTAMLIQFVSAMGPAFFGTLHDLTGGYAIPVGIAALMNFIAAVCVIAGRRSAAAIA